MKKEYMARLRKIEKAMADERDKLRELQDEIEELADAADSGLLALEEAIDRFSELV